MSKIASVLRIYEEMETTLIKLTGYDMERLIELLAAGYTLQPPTYNGSLEELVKEIETDES